MIKIKLDNDVIQIPKEGKDTQALLEKYLDAIRLRSKDYTSGEGAEEQIQLEKSNRVVVETAMLVGWIDTFAIEDASPRKVAVLAKGISDYIRESTQVSPN